RRSSDVPLERCVRTGTESETLERGDAPTQTWIGPDGDSTTMMPRSTPITRPVTTAESPGWLDIDAEGSVDDAAPARAAGTMSTACTAITTCTRSPAAKR